MCGGAGCGVGVGGMLEITWFFFYGGGEMICGGAPWMDEWTSRCTVQ